MLDVKMRLFTGIPPASWDHLTMAGKLLRAVGWSGTTFVLSVALVVMVFRTDDRYRASDARSDWQNHDRERAEILADVRTWVAVYVDDEIRKQVPPAQVTNALTAIETHLDDFDRRLERIEEKLD